MRINLLAVAIVLALSTIVRAASDSDFTLARGTWTAQTYGAFAGANNEALISANVGAGYHIIDNLSLNVEAAGYAAFQQGGDDTGAAELRLIMRHHLIARQRWTIFADVGEGVFEAADRVPPGGTRLNFIFRAGLGATYQLSENTYLIGGIRYYHLSNAKMEGAERNPGINGVEGYVGVMFTWR
jgi:putative salt-induced outer membrane protein YdiY